jgi:large subunit ribosomal protein L35
LLLCLAQLIVAPSISPGALGHAVAIAQASPMKANGDTAFSWSFRPFASEIEEKGSKMPKMKTKSGVKKRFKITGTGKVMAAQAGKRHNMIKRTPKFIRNARGTFVLEEGDARIIKKFAPYGLD